MTAGLIERAMGEPRCSFCKRGRLEVARLVTTEDGKDGICNDCFVVVAKGFADLAGGADVRIA